MGKEQEKSFYPKSDLEVAERRVFRNLAEEMTRRKLFRVSGTMWNFKIRKTVANLSIKAGNMIYLFPFMQTQVYEGLCENYFSLTNHKDTESKCFFWTDWLFCFSFFLLSLLFLADIMANNTTSLDISWPENFWGKIFSLTVFNLKLGCREMYCMIYENIGNLWDIYLLYWLLKVFIDLLQKLCSNKTFFRWVWRHSRGIWATSADFGWCYKI